MNYIKLINAFYDRLETNSLSTSAIALWHALVHVNNKAGWLKEFSVAVSVLCVKTGLSERTITNARNDLKIKGFIDFKSRKGNKSAIYSLVDLSAPITDKHSDKRGVSEINADSVSDNLSCNSSDSVSDNLSALNKLNETKRNETKEEDEEVHSPVQQSKENPFVFFEQNGFGTIGGYIAEKISMWCDDLSDEVVLEALKISVEQGKKNWSYVEAVLKNWFNRGFKTVDQIKAAQMEHKEKMSKNSRNRSSYRKPIRSEQVPGWLHEQQQEKEPEQSNVMDLEAERARLLAIQEKYKKENKIAERV